MWIVSAASSLLNPSFLTSWYFTNADLIVFATEPCCLSQAAIASSIFPSFTLFCTFFINVSKFPFPAAFEITAKRSKEKTITINNIPNNTGTMNPPL